MPETSTIDTELQELREEVARLQDKMEYLINAIEFIIKQLTKEYSRSN